MLLRNVSFLLLIACFENNSVYRDQLYYLIKKKLKQVKKNNTILSVPHTTNTSTYITQQITNLLYIYNFSLITKKLDTIFIIMAITT